MKTVVIVILKATGEPLAYSTVTRFTDHYTNYNPQTIKNYMSKHNGIFEDYIIRLQRLEVKR